MSNAPDEVRAWAQARSEARTTKDWPEADRLRLAIEAAGWRVIDRGSRFSLEPARAPDVVEAGRTRYGSSASVPSIVDQPPTAGLTILIVAGELKVDLARTFEGLRRHAPPDSQVVLVADRPGPAQEAELLAADGPAAGPVGGLPPEIVWTSEPLGWAGALNAGLRRAAASVIVLLDPDVELTGDLLGRLVGVLADPTVAVAGPWGLVTDDLRRFEPAPPGDVDAIDGAALAFRRADLAEHGFLDEHFRLPTNLDIWWSLVLRDEGEDRPPRRAVAIGADLARRPPSSPEGDLQAAAGRERLVRRSFYRVLDRFGARRDLLTGRREAPG